MSNIKPSYWIVNELEILFQNYKSYEILDLASGYGRHSKYIASKNHNVVAVDNKITKLKTFSNHKRIKSICFNMETEDKWPFKTEFDIVIVVNYLFRNNFDKILKLVKLNGYLLYETFSLGNEKYGKPSNPDFLLKKNEFKKLIGKNFEIMKYLNVNEEYPQKSIKQKCLAKRVAF